MISGLLLKLETDYNMILNLESAGLILEKNATRNDWTENDIVAFTDTYVIGHQQVCDQSVLVAVHQILSDIMGWGDKVIIGSLSYGGLVTFNLYSQRFIAPILQLVQFNNDLTTCNIAWNRLNNLLNTKIDVKNGTQTKTIQGNIKFEDVTFYYEEKKPVLHDVFMEFKKGEIYAIVGQSGAGKTTLMHLLFRLWDCISGSITVDGIDIKDFDIDCLRGQISIVSQNIFLLNDTIYDRN